MGGVWIGLCRSDRPADLAWNRAPRGQEEKSVQPLALYVFFRPSSPRYEGNFDEAGLTWRVIHVLGCFPIIGWLRPENVWYKTLRIPIIQREPAGLNLHHDPMAGQENVVRGG